MSSYLKILLIVISILTQFFVFRKIRKAQLQIEDAIFWLLVSAGLVFISIFPYSVIMISELIGIESPANFVFLSIIFILLIKVFIMSIKMSQLEHKLRTITQEIAITKKDLNL